MRQVVPIEPLSVRRLTNDFYVQRRMFPLLLAHSTTTTYKCQGLTLPQIVVSFGDVGSSCPPGMAYIALSRVRRLRDLMIEGPFPSRERLNNMLPYIRSFLASFETNRD